MTTTIFPREEHTQALFREILKDPAACERLMDTFCRSLNSDEDINESVSAKEFAEALFQAYTNQDLSAFLMIICKNTTFDLLRNAFLIPYRFDADGITNPVIMTDEHGELLPNFIVPSMKENTGASSSLISAREVPGICFWLRLTVTAMPIKKMRWMWYMRCWRSIPAYC